MGAGFVWAWRAAALMALVAGSSCGGSEAGDPFDAAPVMPADAGADATTSGADAAPNDAAPLPDVLRPPDAMPEMCTDGDGDSYGDGEGCLGPDCDDTDPAVHPTAPELCNGLDDDCDLGIDEGVAGCCDDSIDNDFDGYGQCADCDDANGAVHPGATEVCNGIDDNCVLGIDEGFDADSDTFTTCDPDPLVFDCDDTEATVYPGAPELCGPAGTGNGVDENCNGFIDEGCAPCDPTDTDGDGVTECEGDCAPFDGSVSPLTPESCDGIDNDCNLFTVDNCGVSDPCNFDGDGDPSNDADVCREDLLCGCVVGMSGMCTGDYQCTSFCNSSETGPIGDGCGSDMTCLFDLLRSANVHGCAVTEDTPGSSPGGTFCADDSECRSLICDRLCIGGPSCLDSYCIDWCGSDAYCPAAGTTCRLQRRSGNMDGRCWPSDGPFLGSSAVGDACTGDTSCDHGFCSAASGVCTEPCCSDLDCPAGFMCSVEQDQINTTYVVPSPGGETCADDTECATGICFDGTCHYRLTETSPMCAPDPGGLGTRRAGAACDTNLDCRSNFCDATLGVCVEVCCNDTSCPSGLTCELQLVEVPSASGEQRVTQSRVCVNMSTDEILSPK